MQRVKYYTTLWFGYQRLGFLSMTQYPLDTFILILSMLLREASGFLGVISVAYAAGGIGNWGVYEISLLFSMCAIIEAIGQAFLDNVWGIRHLVKDGNLDTMLVRPAPLFFQVIGDVAHHQAVISMIFYFSVLFYSMNHLNIEWSFAVVFFLVEFLICGTIINTGIYTIFNCLNFWVVQGEDIAVLIQTCREFTKYPIGAFPTVIRLFFTYVLPFGFVGYYPASYLIKEAGNWVLAAMPVCAFLIGIVAYVIWKAATNSYNSTGT